VRIGGGKNLRAAFAKHDSVRQEFIAPHTFRSEPRRMDYANCAILGA
jgi:hypothetical protein